MKSFTRSIVATALNYPAVTTITLLITAVSASAQGLPTFPGAEGYGKNSVGGRGGAVYEVTTLNPTGPGSLGACPS